MSIVLSEAMPVRETSPLREGFYAAKRNVDAFAVRRCRRLAASRSQ